MKNRHTTLTSLFVILCMTTAFGQKLTFYKVIASHVVKATLSTPTAAEAAESGMMLRNDQWVEYAFDSLGQFDCYEGVIKRLHLNDAKALEMYNKITLPVPTTDDLRYLKVRSIAKNGTIKEVGIEAVKDIEERGRVYKIIAVEGLEVGGELEYIVLNRRSSSSFGREVLQSDIPVRGAKLKIISPSHLIFEAKVYNAPSKITIDSVNNQRVVSVEVENLRAINDEKYANIRANLVRVDYKLSYNLTRNANERLYSWKQAADTFYGYLFNESEKNTYLNAVNEFLAKNKIKNSNPEIAIKTLENTIKKSVSYRESEDYETAADVLKNQYGSKTGLIRLYVAALNALKIPFEVAVSCPRAEAVFDKDFECWNYLDNYILYFPTTKKYLDPINVFYRYGLIPDANEGNYALFVKAPKKGEDEPQHEVRFIPFTAIAQSYDNMLAEVAFLPTMDQIQGKFTRTMVGHTAAQLRPIFDLLKAEQDRKNVIAEIAKSTIKPDVEFSNVVIKNTNMNTDEVNKPFVFGVDAKLRSVVEKAGKKVLFKVGELIGPQVEMYNEGPRQFDIDMGNSHSYNRVLKITIPTGYKISGGLEALKRSITDGAANPDMGFVTNYKLEKNILTVTIDEFYKNVQLSRNVYDTFQRVINAAADFNKVTLVFEKI
jgi:Domain of Unknown Function with PDB structure (DUF3857)